MTYPDMPVPANDGEIFVLDFFDTNVPAEPLKIRGFTVCESGRLYDYSSPYDLEQLAYHRGRLDGGDRMLHYVCLHLKGEISLVDLMTVFDCTANGLPGNAKTVSRHGLRGWWAMRSVLNVRANLTIPVASQVNAAIA